MTDDSGETKQGSSSGIKVISMKSPPPSTPRPPVLPRKLEVKLRPAEMPAPPPPLPVGNLAPPRDVHASRARKRNDYVVFGSATVILACVVAIAVWIFAR